MNIAEIRQLFGGNYIGPEQLNKMLERMGYPPVTEQDLPPLDYSDDLLEASAQDFLLLPGFCGTPGKALDIIAFRDCFGVDPDRSEPCLYNQDWYLKEDFVHRSLEPRWYLVKKNVFEESRAVQPESILKENITFPSAILCTYAFFAYFFASREYLWYHDFVWCSDTDHNGDRIYVGKYHDIDGVNKNGFSIHRHLSLRPCYASITTL